MRIAIEAAKFTSEEANGLRRAMATFRNVGTIGKFEDKMIGNMIARGYDRRIRQKLLRADQGLWLLRLSGKPCRELCPARLYLVMAEALSSRRVLLRLAELAADGLLRAGADRRRRPQERRRGARDRCVLQLCAEHAGGGKGKYCAVRLGFRQIDGFHWVDPDEERLKQIQASFREHQRQTQSVNREGTALPLPLAGEGWGGGVSASHTARVERASPTRIASSDAIRPKSELRSSDPRKRER